jgi:hypothetical protein
MLRRPVRRPDDLRQRPGCLSDLAKRRHRRPQGRPDPRRAIAVKQLGTPGGFSNNPDVKIELPGKLGKVASKMKHVRHG